MGLNGALFGGTSASAPAHVARLVVGYGLFKSLAAQSYASAMSTISGSYIILNSVEFSIAASVFIMACSVALMVAGWHRPHATLRAASVVCMVLLAGTNLTSGLGLFAGMPPAAAGIVFAAVYGVATITANAGWLVPIARLNARLCLATLAAAFLFENIVSEITGHLPGVGLAFALAGVGLAAAALFAVDCWAHERSARREVTDRMAHGTAPAPGPDAAKTARPATVAPIPPRAGACAREIAVELASPLAIFTVLNMVLGLIMAFQVVGEQAVEGGSTFKTVASLAANLALLGVAVFAQGTPNIRKAFEALFPVVALLLMALPFMDHVYGALFGALLVFLQGVVSVTMLFMLLETAKRRQVPIVAAVGAISLASRAFVLAGLLVGGILGSRGDLDDTLRGLIVAMTAIYMLSLVLVGLLRGRRAASKASMAGQAPTAPSNSAAPGPASGTSPGSAIDDRYLFDENGGLVASRAQTGVGATESQIGAGAIESATESEGAVGASGSAGAPSADNAPDPLAARAAELARTHRLTARESEVALLLARGRSAGYIGDELGISANTVRGYIKDAYTKLDVHSKQELIDLYTM